MRVSPVVGRCLATIALVVTTFIASTTEPATATGVTVADEAGYRAALVTLSADTSGAHTITLTADITLDDGNDPIYTGTQDLTVDGDGHTIDAGGTGRILLVNPAAGLPLVTISEVTVTGGSHAAGGGGVVALGGSLAIVDSTFAGNTAGGGGGGGALATYVPTTVSGSTFSGNTALSGTTGGAIRAYAALTVTDSTFSGNAAGYGGAVAGLYDPVSMTNSTLSGNTASVEAGGIRTPGNIVLVHSTLVANGAPADVHVHTDGVLYATASVLAQPLGGGTNCGAPFGTVSGGWNWSDDTSCGLTGTGDTMSGTDPLLTALADHGGLTATRYPKATSPLIDTVPAASCTLGSDQRDHARPFPGNGNCDTGAVEHDDVTDPTITLATPTDRAILGRNTVVNADYSCADEAGGSGLATCDGTVPDGDPIDTSTLGDHDFTVDAADHAGNTATTTHTYTVVDVTDPTIDLVTPPDGAVYARDQVVNADYTCTDEPGGSGLATCAGPVASGSAIDTSTLGDHTFTVDAADHAGNTATASTTYTVVNARPDGRIQRGTGALIGNNIYNNLTAQTVTGTVRRGGTITYYAPVQNDARFGERLRVRGQGTSSAFTIRYYRPNGQNITRQVTAGTFRTPVLARNATYRIRITVTALRTTPLGTGITRTLTTYSTTHPAQKDGVRFTTRRI